MNVHLDPADAPSGKSASVGAVASAARILDFLGAAETPLRLTQISRPLGLNTSTCLNILRTLVTAGFVRTDAIGKTYQLGRRIVELARSALAHGENLNTLRPAMEALSQKHGITVMLWGRLDTEHLILLAAAVGEPLRSIHAELGMRVPLLTGSMGRVLAAGLDRKTARRLFDAVRWETPPDFDTYMDEVTKAAEQGWALDAGYFSTGLWGISVPVSRQNASANAQPDRIVSAVLLANQHDPAIITMIARDLLAAVHG